MDGAAGEDEGSLAVVGMMALSSAKVRTTFGTVVSRMMLASDLASDSTSTMVG